ncbi:MAG: response regulator [Candidatus Brevundimonas phytovorans]|nr:response regulator [Brevundimonas sp.]WEK58473.1 MAG: response regulator [Brevundimonas sp.]
MSALQSLDVLLADDNPNMRSIVFAMLKSIGVTRLREVSDGSAALEALNARPADLAIVDFKMLPVDGVTFTQLVRTAPDSPNPYLPIIMMTGHSEKRRVAQARDAGVTEFLVKPVTPLALLTRIQAVIMHPREFIRTDSYFGPDRRRTQTDSFAGPFRRISDALLD